MQYKHIIFPQAAVKGITSEVGIIPYGNAVVFSYHIQTVYIISDKMDILTPSDSHSIGNLLIN